MTMPLDIRSLSWTQLSTYPPVASSCLFAYDYLLTLQDEVHFVWGSHWSMSKILFLLTRYPTFVDVIVAVYLNTGRALTDAACDVLSHASGWLAICGIVIAEVIMMTRVWALWGRSRSIGILLAAAAIGCVIGAVVAFTHFTDKPQFMSLGDIGPVHLTSCHPNPSGRSKIVFISYLLSTAFEILMIILLLVKGLQNVHRRSYSYLYNIYKDGIVYYVVLSAVSILNLLLLLTAPPEFANLLIVLQRVLHSMLSARMVLRLRADAFKCHEIFTITLPPGDSVFTGFATETHPMTCDNWIGDAHTDVEEESTH